MGLVPMFEMRLLIFVASALFVKNLRYVTPLIYSFIEKLWAAMANIPIIATTSRPKSCSIYLGNSDPYGKPTRFINQIAIDQGA